MTITPELLDNDNIFREKSRRKLLSYMQAMNVNYFPSKMHTKIIDTLERVDRGEITRLMIFCPPQHGKTTIVSEAFPAWYLGKHPDRSIIAATYSGARAKDNGRAVRNQLFDPTYHKIFNTRLSDDSSAADSFRTSVGGKYFSVGVGGATTGRGANIFIIDDPIKGQKEADSPTVRRDQKTWYQGTVYTRLAPDAAVIILMTRWHEDDLAGWLLSEHKDENWTTIIFSAEDGSGNVKAVWPERYSVRDLKRIKAAVGAREWAALYLQSPRVDSGNIFRREHWRYYKELPLSYRRRILSCDTAFKTSASAARSCFIDAIETTNGLFIIDVWAERVAFSSLKRTLENKYAAHHYSAVLVEDRASGQDIINALRAESSMPIVPIRVMGASKVVRAHAAEPFLESGNVYLPENAPWLDSFIEECTQFPAGKFDDQVDAFTQLVNWVRSNGEGTFNVAIITEPTISRAAAVPTEEQLKAAQEKYEQDFLNGDDENEISGGFLQTGRGYI